MIVRVYTPDKREFIGLGELHYEDLHLTDDDDDDKIICTIPNHPHIRMSDGKIIMGIECWWEPVDDRKQ